MNKLSMSIRVVLYHEDLRWVAHCLEFDLVGDGDTIGEAVHSLMQATAIQVDASIEFKNWQNLFRPANPEIFERFAAGREIEFNEPRFRDLDLFSIPEVETREFDTIATCA